MPQLKNGNELCDTCGKPYIALPGGKPCLCEIDATHTDPVQIETAAVLKPKQKLRVAEASNKAMTEAIKGMFQEPQIKAFYETHRDMDSMFANEVPKYKEDCESITKAFNACIDAIKLGELI